MTLHDRYAAPRQSTVHPPRPHLAALGVVSLYIVISLAADALRPLARLAGRRSVLERLRRESLGRERVSPDGALPLWNPMIMAASHTSTS